MEQSESPDKRELIFASALALFTSQGFDRTPTAAISRQAGVATGTLFHYFGTKEDLINALYLRCKTAMVQAIISGSDPGSPFPERFQHMHDNVLQWIISFPQEYLFFQQFSSSSHIRAETRDLGRSNFEPIVDLLREGSRAGWFKPAPADLFFETIVGMINSTATYLLSHPEFHQDLIFRKLCFTMLWDSLRV